MDEKPRYNEVKDVFEARDKAINQKDIKLLRTTELDASRVYIPRFTYFATEVITVVDADTDGLKKVAFVKEKYSFKEYDDYDDETFVAHNERYRIFHLLNTALGWRISRAW